MPQRLVGKTEKTGGEKGTGVQQNSGRAGTRDKRGGRDFVSSKMRNMQHFPLWECPSLKIDEIFKATLHIKKLTLIICQKDKCWEIRGFTNDHL